MELIRGLINIRPRHHGCVATIGNFDGVHLGHQQIIRDLQLHAKELNLPSTVILFEPQPEEYFIGKEAPARLSRLREKLSKLADCGVDRVLCLHFNKHLANLHANAFIEKVLVEGLGVKHLVVGSDFRFGQNREGDVALLSEAGKKHNFKLDRDQIYLHQDTRISSTRIRQALEIGDLRVAEEMLGHPFGMFGRVVHGDKRGRIIGFPTANIYLHRNKVPILGVYAVEVYGLEAEPVYGVANVGTRPTVGGTRTLLEVHMFDFDQAIYDKYVQVNFIYKLRCEKKFDSFDELKQQIFKDADNAKNYFERMKVNHDGL